MSKTDLLAAVEGAEAQNQHEVLEAVCIALGPFDTIFSERIRKLLEAGGYESAALALVERKLPGTWWGMAKGKITQNEPTFGAALYPEGDPAENVLGEGAAESAPLAIILALLRALAHQGAE